MTYRVTENDLTLPDGRTLHHYDTGADSGDLTVVWHHGTPNLGPPPEPLFPAAEKLGLRWVSYDRPGYGGSTPRPGRDVASAAADVERIVDALGVGRFATLGHSGGGPHALACGALLGDRVLAVASGAAPAPYPADGLDWFAGFAPSGEASLRAAVAGRAAKEAYEKAPIDDPDPGFLPADWAALAGEWSWFDSVVGPAMAAGPAAAIDDDLALVSPWGFDPAALRLPVLIVHGTGDRMVPGSHGEWLARHVPGAEAWLIPEAGHLSVLAAGPDMLRWLRTASEGG